MTSIDLLNYCVSQIYIYTAGMTTPPSWGWKDPKRWVSRISHCASHTGGPGNTWLILSLLISVEWTGEDLPSKTNNSDGKKKSEGGGIMCDEESPSKENEQDVGMATVREWRARASPRFQI